MNKIAKVMEEYKEGKLHSGSKKGPEVHSKKQALAIALSEARKGKKMEHKVGSMKSHYSGKSYSV